MNTYRLAIHLEAEGVDVLLYAVPAMGGRGYMCAGYLICDHCLCAGHGLFCWR